MFTVHCLPLFFNLSLSLSLNVLVIQNLLYFAKNVKQSSCFNLYSFYLTLKHRPQKVLHHIFSSNFKTATGLRFNI